MITLKTLSESYKMTKFTKADLKYHVTNMGSFFFTKKAMQFFGDTMANYGLRSYDANTWELYRKNPVKHNLKNSAYFDKTTYKQVFIKNLHNLKKCV